MTQIIAATYEVEKRLASGGGGVVYLARHLRLGKQVVLKADKRSLTARVDDLRREVDSLKNLSHTYIPQVYDFFVEDGTVYTVMDYIEGESLDRPLARGERFSQARIIKWARQLLQALCYLHSRPPHGILHGDIKPANIMLTPEDDIRLIDFNIALALGEKGAVKVGSSRGYSSPEHYGIDYRGLNSTASKQDDVLTQLPAVSPETQLPGSTQSTSSTSAGHTVLLDVRSDIYSLGATLYHLLTGIRPAQDAREIAPITDPGVSEAVRQIIQKAMNPNPDLRYQTAAQMLDDFDHLHQRDPRARALRKRTRITAAVCAFLIVLGGAAVFFGLNRMERAQALAAAAAETARKQEQAAKEAEAAAKRALEYISQSEQAFERGSADQAAQLAVQALELHTPYDAQAQSALTRALGVYDLRGGFGPHLVLELPGAPLKAALSPSGRRAAVVTSGTVSVYELETGECLAQLDMYDSALADAMFLQEDVLLYAADTGLRAYDFIKEQDLWTAAPATMIALSADSSTAAAILHEENTVRIYDTDTGAIRTVVSLEEKKLSAIANSVFADPEDDVFSLDKDGSRLAVSFSDGGLEIYDLRDSAYNAEVYDSSDYTHFEGGFCGDWFAFAATGRDESVYAVLDLQSMTQLGGFSSTMPFHAQATEDGLYLSLENVLVRLDPISGEQTEAAYTEKDITAFWTTGENTVAALDGGGFAIFNSSAKLLRQVEQETACNFVCLAGDYALISTLDSPQLRVLRRDEHEAQQLLRYDAELEHDEARLSADGSTVMLFRYDAFWIYDLNGTLLCEMELPDAEQIYDQQFRRQDGESYLEVIYNDGLIRAWSAADGSLLWERQGEQPEESLYEEFLTDNWRITSPLHGTPEVYDIQTGEHIASLQDNAYLTYVTQVGEYVITEYVSGDGERYGILLDSQCNTLAELPQLCDITEQGQLIFDDMCGNLRQTRLYTLQELLALAEPS